MRLMIKPDPDSVAEYVANYIVQRIVKFSPSKMRPFVLGLPMCNSPVDIYHRLVELFQQGKVSFENVVTFNMDEYVGLPRDHPESCHSFMWHNLFKHVDIKAENVHLLDGNAEHLDLECRQYEETIARYGGIELLLSAVGTDGHMAFNEPGSSLTSRTRVKTLAYETIMANAAKFGGVLAKVPKLALTMGVGTVMDAREVVVMMTGAQLEKTPPSRVLTRATGAQKALALSKCIEEGVSHMWTASAIQNHLRAMIVCDENATLELRVKTVRYFKSIQEVQNMILMDERAHEEGQH